MAIKKRSSASALHSAADAVSDLAAQAPAAASSLVQSVTAPPASTTLAHLDDEELVLPEPSISTKEVLLGQEGSFRRDLSFWVTGMVVSTVCRMACFSPLILGNYLLHELGPVERETVRWYLIVAVRGIELAFGQWIWKRVDGQMKKDGILFGIMITAISRISLYAFEHAYFLLSIPTVATILSIDVFSLTAAFSLLPTFLPHSLPARPGLTAFKRLQQNPELLWNVAFAAGLATTFGALSSYLIEHLGGMAFIKEKVFDLIVPSVAVDGLTPSEMMANPTITIPTLRSFIRPGPMHIHLGHALLETIFLLPLASILPAMSARKIGASVFALIATTSTLLLWDVLPIKLEGAVAVGLTLALRAGIMATVVAWVLEELRMIVYSESVTMVLVGQDGEAKEIVEADLLVAEKVTDERSRL